MKKYDVFVKMDYVGGYAGRTSCELIVTAENEQAAKQIALDVVKSKETAYGDKMYENCAISGIREYVEPSKEETAWFDEMFPLG